MANRNLRIKSNIAKCIAEIIQMELKNPRIGFVSVNQIDVYDDYSHAKVYVTFLGAKYPHQNFNELKKTEGYVRSSLAKKIDLYKVPQIDFIYDESYERAESLEKALAQEEADINEAKKGQ
ncbi:MAG: 30S ribosome-binding factor RbfA [Bacilli bacterium]|nr:30S ribosome-binding factor RbfA [Bacilli bacterium]